MPALRLEAFRRLEAAIKAVVPDLETVLTARPGKAECLPNLTISPVRLRFFGDQPEEVFRAGPTSTVYNVGRYEGPVQLRLTASNYPQRMELEEKVRGVFFSDEDRPGLLRTWVVSCPQLGTQLACFEAEEDEWNDAKTFDSRFESIMLLTATIPALAITEAPTIDELRLGYTADFETAFTGTTAVPPAVELVKINSDGSISAVT